MSQWLAERSFTEMVCLIGCLFASLSMLVGAIRGTK